MGTGPGYWAPQLELSPVSRGCQTRKHPKSTGTPARDGRGAVSDLGHASEPPSAGARILSVKPEAAIGKGSETPGRRAGGKMWKIKGRG